MERKALGYLQGWLTSSDRLPLVIRGARQVGKTWLVRQFAKVAGKQLIEVNLEKRRSLENAFVTNDPLEILKKLGSALEIAIEPENSLLFIDEIQEVPELYAKLRWFAEDMPQLPVIAAGSLLELVLHEHTMSMPVGRITYLYLEPLSFEEFLLALEKQFLVDRLHDFTWQEGMFELMHENLMNLFKEYLIVGGMPAAVQNWVHKQSTLDLSRTHNDIIQTYRDDFNKYSKKISALRLNEVVDEIPLALGQKFVYSQVSHEVRTGVIKQALDLLVNAKVCHKVQATAANGVPLAAEVNSHYTKIILLDVGLCATLLNLSLVDLTSITELSFVNKGGIAEQVVGQLLRTIDPFFQRQALYYWVNTDKHANAELDYVLQHGTHVIPIEVKAGTTGTLKSLHRFMYLKNRSIAVRINSDLPSSRPIQVKDTLGNPVQYTLKSIPFYLVGELHRLLDIS
jgi:hypothetical protein